MVVLIGRIPRSVGFKKALIIKRTLSSAQELECHLLYSSEVSGLDQIALGNFYKDERDEIFIHI
ncbi:protein N-terminal glutamine amidohydrolase [Gossypium australe]|uniref:Protein N-terminal glutamine amidohydrolase n=1 Tax=Gossypium australe TaxID=47621 RepID=A0A5B6TUW7_9ROSI|nr:protein N-terminal glutamine amidohydrolase [Gossypium australe]